MIANGQHEPITPVSPGVNAPVPGTGRYEMTVIAAVLTVAALLLFFLSRINYLLFHGLVELASIAIAFTLFILTWNVRRLLHNDMLKLLGIGYAFIAIIDLFHTLAYKGMTVFSGYGANLPTQLWISARYLQAVTLCVAPLLLRRRAGGYLLAGSYAAVVGFLLALVFSGYFPDCFIEGEGLTRFKIGSEYVIVALLGIALILFRRVRTSFIPRVYRLLIVSLVCTIFSELAFTTYLSVYGFTNMLGHLLKLAAFYLIYRALLVTGFQEPYQLLFRELKLAYDKLGETNVSLELEVEERTAAEHELREARNQLEALVAARTAELQTSNTQLLQSESRLIEAQRIAHLGNWELDLVNNALFWSDEVYRIFEIDQGEFGASYEAFLAAVHPDDRDAVNSAYTRSLTDRIPYDIVHRLLMADGRIKYVNERCETVYGEDGHPLRSMGTIHDITEIKRSEEALLYLAAIVEFSDDAIIGKTPEGIIQSWNRGAERLYGYPAAEIVGRSVAVLIPEDRAAEMTDIFVRITRGVPVEHFETVRLRKGGSRIDVSLTVSPIFDTAGRVIGASTIAVDISERKRAEAKLLQLNAELQLLSSAIEQSPISIIITDSSGSVQFVNPKFSAVTGYTAEEILGKNPRLLKSGNTSAEAYRHLWATIAGGHVWHGEFCNRKKNGEFFFENATIAPVKNGQGEITHYIAIKEDITEKRKLEDQLRQAQKMEAIGTLAGGVAHDFNNILTAIIGYGNLMEMKMAGDDPLRVNLSQILAAADRAAELTRSLLAFSRKQVINLQAVNINDVVSQAGKFLQRIIGEDIELRVNYHDDRLAVNADSGQIGQVLMNLATNARDAMPNGGILSIETALSVIDADFVTGHGFGSIGDYALISVTDTGCGMDGETRKRLFEPFFTTKEVGKGTGLGLSIVYGIIKQHSGYIDLWSEPGQGTTFAIYLPLIDAPTEPKTKAAPIPAVAGTETLLIADDDVALRSLAAEMFGTFGYTVLTAADGEEALAIFRENREKIALVILDVIMPRMNGKEACDEIRKLSPDCKVVFISGYTADIIHRRGVLDEGETLVTKPLRLEKLLQKVRDMLDDRMNS